MTTLKKIITPSRIIIFLALFSVISSVTYGVLIQQSVEQVVMRKEKEQALTKLRTSVSELESTYISKTKDINSNLATAMGYSAPSQTIFLSRATLGQNNTTPKE
jgi:hypothetical protein